MQNRLRQKASKKQVTPKEMTIEEIKQNGLRFQKRGKNAMEAGFDGVEIHSFKWLLTSSVFHRTQQCPNG